MISLTLRQIVEFQKSELGEFKETINDYEKIISKQKVMEDEIQDFFENNHMARNLFF